MANQLTYKPGSLETMTVQQAKDAGRLDEYNQIVAGFGTGPITTNQMSGAGTQAYNQTTNNNNSYSGLGAGATAYVASNPPPTPETKTKSAGDLYKESVSSLTPVNSEQLLRDIRDEQDVKEKGDTARKLKARIDAANARAQANLDKAEK